MPTTTSLLKSANAARQKITAQQDAIAAFEWDNSAQTYDDFVNYSKYLSGRQSSTSDVSEQLTLATKLRSAQRSYTSNELQRVQMQIMEGGASIQDKQDAIINLYKSAVANGDYNLAQNLASQYDSLSIQAQNQRQAAISSSVASNSKTLKNTINSLIKGTDYIDVPGVGTVAPFGLISNEIKTNQGKLSSGVRAFAAAADTLSQIQNIVNTALQNASSQEEADSIISQYGGYFDNTKKINILGTSFTPQEIIYAAQSDELNNPLYKLETAYNPATGQNESKLVRNSVENFQYVRTGQDENGNDIYAPLQLSRAPQDTGQFQSLDTQITNNGEIIGPNGEINLGTGKTTRKDALTIGNRLKALGIQATKGPNGTVNITLPDGNTYNAVITADGKIRYYGPPGQYSGGGAGLYEIGLFDQNNFGIDPKTGKPYSLKAGQVREVSPDEESIFGQRSNFGGNVSRASAAGERIASTYLNPDPLGQNTIADLRGSTFRGVAQPRLSGPISTVADFTGRSVPVLSNLLQSSALTLQAAQAQRNQEAARQAALLQSSANYFQPAANFNLNQQPVQQYAQNGAPIRQLTVARPLIQPKVTVAPATPQPRLSVSKPSNQGIQLQGFGSSSGGFRIQGN